MSQRLFQIVVFLVLAFAALTPLAETIDTWDRTPIPSSDTELQIAAFAVGIGVVLTLAKLLRYIPSFQRAEETPLTTTAGCFPWLWKECCSPTASPPSQPLRI